MALAFLDVPFSSFSALALWGLGIPGQTATLPGLGGAGDIPACAALSEGDGNPPVLIFGDVFPKQRARRLEKLKDRWGKTMMVVTQ